jgi:hypothetical protein
MKELVFLMRGGCISTTSLRANLDAALRSLGLPADYQFIDQATLAATDPRLGYPTPTMLLGGADLFGLAQPTPPYPEPA